MDHRQQIFHWMGAQRCRVLQSEEVRVAPRWSGGWLTMAFLSSLGSSPSVTSSQRCGRWCGGQLCCPPPPPPLSSVPFILTCVQFHSNPRHHLVVVYWKAFERRQLCQTTLTESRWSNQDWLRASGSVRHQVDHAVASTGTTG